MLRLKTRVSVVVAMVVVACSAVAGPPAFADSFSGGDITSSFTLSKGGSPYLINTPIRIAQGATLTIEPGVEIKSSASVMIQIAGSLNAIGTANDPILIDFGVGQSIVSVGDFPSTVILSHVLMSGGSPLKLKQAQISDSEFFNQVDCGTNEILMNQSSFFARNALSGACGLDLNIDFGLWGPRGTAQVANNLFIGNSVPNGNPCWIVASSLWKDELNLFGNTFQNLTDCALRQGFFPTKMTADGNYWGAKTLDQVRGHVPGSVGDIFTPASISLSQISSVPSPGTPTNSKQLDSYNRVPWLLYSTNEVASVKFTYEKPLLQTGVSGQQVGIWAISDESLNPKLVTSYSGTLELFDATSTDFSFTTEQLIAIAAKLGKPKTKYLAFRVRSVLVAGYSNWGNPAFVDLNKLATQLGLADSAIIKLEGALTQANFDAAFGIVSALPDSPEKSTMNDRLNALKVKLLASQAKKKTITCVKGSKVKKITAVAPKCPKGYKKR